jgi:phosphoglycolate phosphatase-like HAD superfamily hydrolase
MAELRAIIFDVDGTLADTERDGHRVAFNRAFEEAGLAWHWSVDFYAELLAGNAYASRYLDLTLLRRLHQTHTRA